MSPKQIENKQEDRPVLLMEEFAQPSILLSALPGLDFSGFSWAGGGAFDLQTIVLCGHAEQVQDLSLQG